MVSQTQVDMLRLPVLLINHLLKLFCQLAPLFGVFKYLFRRSKNWPSSVIKIVYNK